MAYHITEKCIGCTVCASLCPVFAITGEKGTRHTVNEARCVECGVCARGCPKGAVLTPDNTPSVPVPRAKWPKPRVDDSVCSACGMCMDICRPKAIKISYPEFRGDIKARAYLDEAKKCTGCGMCASLCPLQAIEMGEVQS